MNNTTLRLANKNDVELFFNWVNDKLVRQNAINKEKVKWENHITWFKNKILSQDTYIYILEQDCTPIGQIRFDKEQDGFLIDYSIDKKFRGKGFGQKILIQSLQKIHEAEGKNITIKATVLKSNIGSQKVFTKVGFNEDNDASNNLYVHYKLKGPLKTYIILSSKQWNQSTVDNLNNNLPAYNWIAITDKKEFNLDNLIKLNPDKIFIPHWSYIISEEIFSKFDCIVFHMTNLPYGRGGSPLQNLIERGHEQTKISAIKIVRELDAGPIFLKEDLSLSGTAEEIFIRANVIIEQMIKKIVSNNLSSKAQVGNPTLFKRRTPDMSNIKDINELDKLYDYIRMLDAENYPKAFIETEFFKFEFSRASLKADKSIITDVRITKK